VTDQAEAWLQQNDPDYQPNSETWKQVRSTGDYITPRQEIPWQLGAELATLVATETGEYVEHASRRACERCYDLFVPNTPWHRFCSTRCRRTIEQRRARAARRVS
jgi:hypothetical protein